LYGDETLILREVYQKYLGRGRMENIIWTDRVRNDEVLYTVKEKRYTLQTIKRKTANWKGHILRRKCLLKPATDGKIEGTVEVARRRGRRRMQLLDHLKEKKGYWKLKDVLDRTLWRTLFGIGYEPVVRQAID
jgi:hypothetical protein